MSSDRKIRVQKPFSVYVGIDFGTDGTGLAYALPSGEVFVHQKWKGYKRQVELKPKTRLLLDQDGKFLAFGQPATTSYITMGGAQTDWMLFEKFKMSLYRDELGTAAEKDENDSKFGESLNDNDNNNNGKNKNKNHKNPRVVDISDELTAVNGKRWSSEKVFIEALKYIKDQAFKYFSINKLNIDSINQIQWILTVPAIWSDKAKFKMEQWAFKAGLTNRDIYNHLKIVYEPDCASLSIQYEIQKLKNERKKKENQEKQLKQEKDKEKEKNESNKDSNDNDSSNEIAENKDNNEKNKEDNNDNEEDNEEDNEDKEKEKGKDKDKENEDDREDDNDDDGDDVSRPNETENENDKNEIKEENEDNVDKDKEDNREDSDGDRDKDDRNENSNSNSNSNENENQSIFENEDNNEDREKDKDKDRREEEEDDDDSDDDERAKDQDKEKEKEVKEEKDDETDVVETEVNNELNNEESKTEEKGNEKNKENKGIDDSNAFLKGERYILIDAGGGTCDVACHEIMSDDFGVKEIVHPTGGPWGSTKIDDYFVDLLYKIFKNEWIEEFRAEDAGAYIELIENFRVAKQEFYKNMSEKVLYEQLYDKEFIDEQNSNMDENFQNIHLPFDFSSFLENKMNADDVDDELQGCDLDVLVNAVELCHDNVTGLVELEDEYLRLHYRVWKELLFDKIVEPILSHIEFLLNDTIMADRCDYICLVGGLGSSGYLQHRIISQFGIKSRYGLNIIIPKRPILSVVDGAARFGLQPDYIQARTLAKTYGNAIDPKHSAIQLDDFDPDYVKQHSYCCDHTQSMRLKNVFSVYARKNQTIHIKDKPIVRKYKRFNKNQKKVRISVYSSDEETPKVVRGKPLAKTTVIFPDNSEELSITVELFFGDTKIRVFAYPDDDPENRREMSLDYDIL